MCAEGHRPDLPGHGHRRRVSQNRHERPVGRSDMSVDDMVNEGVRRAYLHPDNVLRASIVARPGWRAEEHRATTRPRSSTRRSSPATPVEVKLAAKGGGSENKAKFVMLNPSDEHRRVGSQDGADDGRRLVSAGHARHRHRRQRREGDAAGQGVADGSDRHARAQGARTARPDRRAAPRDLRRE